MIGELFLVLFVFQGQVELHRKGEVIAKHEPALLLRTGIVISCQAVSPLSNCEKRIYPLQILLGIIPL